MRTIDAQFSGGSFPALFERFFPLDEQVAEKFLIRHVAVPLGVLSGPDAIAEHQAAERLQACSRDSVAYGKPRIQLV